MADKEAVSTKSDYTNTSTLNILDYLIRTTVAGMVNTCIPVVVTSVTRNGDSAGAGFLSAKPLIMQRDGENNSLPNTEIPKLPYFRYQFGDNAVICDPEVGDVGLAVFAKYDTSTVNGDGEEKQPGSFRMYDMSDGFYLGGFYGKKPVNYIHLDSDTIKIIAPTKVLITSPTVNIQGDVIIKGDTTITGEMTAKGIVYSTHTHGGVRSGDDSTGAPN